MKDRDRRAGTVPHVAACFINNIETNRLSMLFIAAL